jgi:hypothetical protein
MTLVEPVAGSTDTNEALDFGVGAELGRGSASAPT